jgi:hypothetical protein
MGSPPRKRCTDLGRGDSSEQAEPQGSETAAGQEQRHRQQQNQASVRPACEGGSPGKDGHSEDHGGHTSAHEAAGSR